MTSTNPEPMNHKDAKAQAKAAKAYAKAQRPFYKKKRFIFPAALAVIVIIAVASGGGDKPEDATASDTGTHAAKGGAAPKKAAPKAIAVQAKAILGEFESNEAAADLKYKDKTIAVTGFVNKVDTELFNDDEYVVQVGEGGDFVLWTVNCDDQSAETAAVIKKGQKVTVTGDFEDGGDLGVEMHGCKIS